MKKSEMQKQHSVFVLQGAFIEVTCTQNIKSGTTSCLPGTTQHPSTTVPWFFIHILKVIPSFSKCLWISFFLKQFIIDTNVKSTVLALKELIEKVR